MTTERHVMELFVDGLVQTLEDICADLAKRPGVKRVYIREELDDFHHFEAVADTTDHRFIIGRGPAKLEALVALEEQLNRLVVGR